MWKALSVIAALLAAGAAFLSYLNKGDAEQERELLATSKSNFADASARHKEVLDEQTAMIRKNKAMEARRDVALEEQEAEKGKLEAKTQEVVDTNDRIKELEAASDVEVCKLNDLEAEIAETKPDTFIGVAAKLDLWLFILGWSQSPRFLELSPEMRLGYMAACDA